RPPHRARAQPGRPVRFQHLQPGRQARPAAGRQAAPAAVGQLLQRRPALQLHLRSLGRPAAARHGARVADERPGPGGPEPDPQHAGEPGIPAPGPAGQQSHGADVLPRLLHALHAVRRARRGHARRQRRPGDAEQQGVRQPAHHRHAAGRAVETAVGHGLQPGTQ
ncbi:hypothetical protein OY671_011295, partial [Metschnikowia pulcherrima]